MRKAILSIAINILLFIYMPFSIYGMNYTFGEKYKEDAFGNPTTSSKPADNSAIENIRRNKDAALFAPEYGVFSGNIPTAQSSRYHESDANKSKFTAIPDFLSDENDFLSTNFNESGTSNINNLYSAGGNASSTFYDSSQSKENIHTSETSSSRVNISYSDINSDSRITSVTKYSDGSIGTIQIPRFGLNVKVFSGSDSATMRKGVGKFEESSEWDGNISLLSHNRGSYDYFRNLKDISIGDEIKYTTKIGTRTYRVEFKEKINEYDTSYINDTSDNALTLFTCVENVPSLRWCVRAVEVR